MGGDAPNEPGRGAEISCVLTLTVLELAALPTPPSAYGLPAPPPEVRLEVDPFIPLESNRCNVDARGRPAFRILEAGEGGVRVLIGEERDER